MKIVFYCYIYSMDKWNYTCRSCLSTAESFAYFIYKDITPETYLFCTSVEVKYDGLPKSLCGNCYHLLIKFSKFKKKCIESENKLLGFAKNTVLKNEPVSEVKLEIKDSKLEDIEDAAKESFIKLNVTDGVKTNKPDSIVIKNTTTSVLLPRKPIKKNVKVVKQKRIYDFKCDRCERSFAFKERLEGHMLEHEGKEAPIQCKICDKTFKHWSGLRCHIESVHALLPFAAVTCAVCSKVCKSASTLRAHHRTHQPRERVCDECGRTFKSDVTFKNHLETHIKNRERNFTCEHCGRKYISKKTLAKHVYRRHTDRRFICDYCQYVFTDKANLIRHVMLHEGRHPKFECDVCSRLLTSQASLVLHKRIHSGEKPFACTHCGKKFSDRAVLTEHERVHTGERPFACSLCQLRFARRSSMRRHMKVHK